MTIYLITLVAIILYGIACFHRGVSNRNKKIFLYLAFIHMGIIMAARSFEVGNDTRAYYLYFLKWGSLKMQIGGATQPIYYWYNRLVYLISHNGQIIILCNTMLEVTGIALFIYFFSENVFLSAYLWVTLYFFCESMNIARQFLALSLFMIAFILLWKKNRVKSAIILMLLAIGTHNLIITMLPVLLVKFIRLTRKKIFILVGFGIMFVFLFDSLFSAMINLFCSIFPYYSQYLMEGRLNVYNEGGSRNVLLSLFYLAFVILGLYAIKQQRISETQRENLIILLVPCIITVAIGLGAVNIVSVQRIKILYSTFFVCFIPNVIIACFDKRNEWIINIAVMVVTLLPFAVQLAGNYAGVVPYKFFWQ